MAAKEDAWPSRRWVVWIEREAGCPGEESLDCDARLEASEGRADAEVEATTERVVGSRTAGVEVFARITSYNVCYTKLLRYEFETFCSPFG